MNVRRLLDRVHQAERIVEGRAGDEKAVVRPHDGVVLFHQLAGRDRDLRAARHHPRNDPHAAGKHDGAFRRACPQRLGERLGKPGNFRRRN